MIKCGFQFRTGGFQFSGTVVPHHRNMQVLLSLIFMISTNATMAMTKSNSEVVFEADEITDWTILEQRMDQKISDDDTMSIPLCQNSCHGALLKV